jgi:hypothetical protein
MAPRGLPVEAASSGLPTDARPGPSTGVPDSSVVPLAEVGERISGLFEPSQFTFPADDSTAVAAAISADQIGRADTDEDDSDADWDSSLVGLKRPISKSLLEPGTHSPSHTKRQRTF